MSRKVFCRDLKADIATLEALDQVSYDTILR